MIELAYNVVVVVVVHFPTELIEKGKIQMVYSKTIR